MTQKTAELADRVRRPFTGRATEGETEFLRDVQGFIDFAIDNGLSLAVIATALSHDVNELFRFAFDLEAAKAKGFSPKVAGFSKITPDSFCQSEEVD